VYACRELSEENLNVEWVFIELTGMGLLGGSRSERTQVPDWIGRVPFSPEQKRTVVVTKSMEVSTLYGYVGHQVESQIFVSTDKITLSDWTLPPGSYYAPPGLHLHGDELYYIVKGNPTAFNPETGETLQLREGDTLLIPRGTRHQIFNFTEQTIHALSVAAPILWADDGMGTEIPDIKEPKFYRPK